jgi:hypothetical protein
MTDISNTHNPLCSSHATDITMHFNIKTAITKLVYTGDSPTATSAEQLSTSAALRAHLALLGVPVEHSSAAQLAERVPVNTSTAQLARALAAAHSALQQPQGIVVFVVQVSGQREHF